MRLVTLELVLSGSTKIAVLLLDQVLLLDKVLLLDRAAVCCWFSRGASLLPTPCNLPEKDIFEVRSLAEHSRSVRYVRKWCSWKWVWTQTWRMNTCEHDIIVKFYTWAKNNQSDWLFRVSSAAHSPLNLTPQLILSSKCQHAYKMPILVLLAWC